MAKIIVKSEVGREVNPYAEFISPNFTLYGSKGNPEWAMFEQSVQSYPAPGIPDGEHEAKLVWQYRPKDTNWNFIRCRDDLWETTVPHAFDTRQIYVTIKK